MYLGDIGERVRENPGARVDTARYTMSYEKREAVRAACTSAELPAVIATRSTACSNTSPPSPRCLANKPARHMPRSARPQTSDRFLKSSIGSKLERVVNALEEGKHDIDQILVVAAGGDGEVRGDRRGSGGSDGGALTIPSRPVVDTWPAPIVR